MTIDLNETPLEQGLGNAVRSLFNRSDYKTLKRIIETEVKKKAVSATNSALKSSDFPRYKGDADGELKLAIRYQTALDVLSELETRKEDFTVITVK